MMKIKNKKYQEKYKELDEKGEVDLEKKFRTMYTRDNLQVNNSVQTIIQ